jgi:tRNA(Ile)-lysidine synthase
LEDQADRPVALALSGGGDSLALLVMTADWARRRGRSILALTVDHGLNPDSRDWTRRAGEQAGALGADWRGLAWTGPKPATGLPAAARQARHALIADAAREAGARVILLAHTREDAAEADWMRAQGTPIGRLRHAAPSPAWPEGRGLVLLRPLLEERRAHLRDLLQARALDWLEDPANFDARFARPRARAALEGDAAPPVKACALAWTPPDQPQAAAGVLTLPRTAPLAAFAAAVACVAGAQTAPRGRVLERLRQRLAEPVDAVATLSGARLELVGAQVRIMRQMRGRDPLALAPAPLCSGAPHVWDGRFEIESEEPGLRVAPALGRLARLSSADRAWLFHLPIQARSAFPVLLADDDAPVLAFRRARMRGLVGSRFGLWARSVGGETPHEAELAQAVHGAKPWNHLF